MGRGQGSRQGTGKKVILAVVIVPTACILLLVLALRGPTAVRSEQLTVPVLPDVPESA